MFTVRRRTRSGRGLSSVVTNGPLTAHANASASDVDCVYAYGATSMFSSNGYQATDYSVDAPINPS
jgi:hypothetical protein